MRQQVESQYIHLSIEDKFRLEQRVNSYIIGQLRRKFGESFDDVEEQVVFLMKDRSLSELKVLTLDLINAKLRTGTTK